MSARQPNGPGDTELGETATPWLSSEQWRAMALQLGVSGRELDVIRGILDGADERTVAKRLGISVHTVHTHLNRVYRRLRVNSRSNLILRVFAQFAIMARCGPPGFLERNDDSGGVTEAHPSRRDAT